MSTRQKICGEDHDMCFSMYHADNVAMTANQTTRTEGFQKGCAVSSRCRYLCDWIRKDGHHCKVRQNVIEIIRDPVGISRAGMSIGLRRRSLGQYVTARFELWPDCSLQSKATALGLGGEDCPRV